MNAYIESFKIQIFLCVIVDFVDTLAVLWIAAVCFKTVICLGRDKCKTMWLNIEVFWDVTPRRLVNSYRRFEEAKCHHIRSPAVPQEWAREE